MAPEKFSPWNFLKTVKKWHFPTRFELGRDILKVDGTLYFICFFIKALIFCNYLWFLAGENVQIASDITGWQHLLTILKKSKDEKLSIIGFSCLHIISFFFFFFFFLLLLLHFNNVKFEQKLSCNAGHLSVLCFVELAIKYKHWNSIRDFLRKK